MTFITKARQRNLLVELGHSKNGLRLVAEYDTHKEALDAATDAIESGDAIEGGRDEYYILEATYVSQERIK